MANFVFGPCPNSAQKWSKFASHSVYSDARHVFGEMSPWRPCGAAAHHPSCRVSKCPRPSKCGRRGPLAPLLTPRCSLGLLPRLNAGERPHPAMAVAELHGCRCSFSSKRSHAQPAPPPPPPLPPLQPAPLGRGGRPPECHH